MSKAQIYFDHADELGTGSNLRHNFWNHCENKGEAWGFSDKQTRSLFPRGKVYEKLYQIQFEKYIGGFEDE